MRPLIERIREGEIPRHIALIMDGNGRWAESQGWPRTAGYQAGAQAAERLLRFAGERLGIRYITLYAFSTENWKRPETEVAFVMKLLERFLREKTGEFVQRGIRLRVAGNVEDLPESLQRSLDRSLRETKDCDALHLTVALSYGSRQEIVQACARIGEEIAAGRMAVSDVSEQALAARMYAPDVPDPDLIIRTSGEIRLSNFLLWQAAYAELYFTDVLWPDFAPVHLIRAIADYQMRHRRFGSVERKES